MILPEIRRAAISAGHRLGGQEDSASVGLHDAVPLLDAHVEDGRVRIDSRVGDGHRDGAERFLGLGHESGDLTRVAHVHHVREHVPTQRGGSALQGGLAHVAQGYTRPGRVKRLRNALPDAGGGAGDQDDAVGEVKGHHATGGRNRSAMMSIVSWMAG